MAGQKTSRADGRRVDSFHALVVEDDNANRTLLATVLRRRGHAVTACATAEEGWSACQQSTFPLVLLDWMLPGMSGLELCRKLRTLAQAETITILMVTARDAPEDLQKALAAGADDYVVKPITLERLHLRLGVAEAKTRDRLERGQALQEWRLSQERYRLFVQGLPDVVYQVDPDGLFTFVNDAVREWGYEPDELVGKHFEEVVHPDHVGEVRREKVLPRLRGRVTGDGDAPGLFDERRTGRRGTRNLEVRLTAKTDQERIGLLEVIGEVSACGLYDRDVDHPEKRFLGTMGVIRDVTKRKQIEQSLRASEEKYRRLIEDTRDIVYAADREAVVGYVSPQIEALGYSAEELVGRCAMELIHPEDVERVRSDFRRTMETGDEFPTRFRLRVRDGSYVPVEEMGRAVREGEEILGVTGVIRDITEQKRMEEEAKIHQQQLLQADKMVALGTLAAGAAHEINNPNSFVMLNAATLLEVWKDAAPILETHAAAQGDGRFGGMSIAECREHVPRLLREMLDGSRRIDAILKNMKTFARPQTEETWMPVDVNAIVASAITLVGTALKKRAGAFSVTYGNDLPVVSGNFQRLQQVIVNLLVNAYQALPDPEKGIWVTTAHEAHRERVTVEIRDEGVGIAEADLRHVTEPFFTTKRDQGGTGLGLSVSARIVAEHSGMLRFASEPGKGTTATLALPTEPLPRTTTP